MVWQEIWNDYINITPDLVHIVLRLSCAMLVGIIIGLEREYTHRPAGLRTHILVALGACVVSILGEKLFTHYAVLGATPDPARLSAQVITGVGFLGAGTIMKEGPSVKGLTTAASVWAVACLGIAAGFGYYAVALLGTVFIFITLTVIEALQHRFINSGGSKERYLLHTADVPTALTALYTICQNENVILTDVTIHEEELGHEIKFRATFHGRRHKQHHARFLSALIAIEGVSGVHNGTDVVTYKE